MSRWSCATNLAALSTHSRASGEPAGAFAGARPPPQPAAASTAAVQARHQGAFAVISYVEPQFQQPKVPAIFTFDTFVPVMVESVLMIAEYVPVFES